MKELDDFWCWLGMTPKEYSIQGINQSSGEGEFCYPHYEQLITCAIQLISKEEMTNQEIDDFLTILALDNEPENLLDYCIININAERLKQIIKRGLQHLQPEARWQIAEMAYQAQPHGYIDYLQRLAEDTNDIVNKRARKCLNDSLLK